ncbi:hypothetical protein NEDG_01610 [Nematocida displodere]|uniref:Uncharacterized protein n=1 Tax=Nematocida displodere TaxID=1805483 RepID=A0A177EGX2_9MICR|nr:hypothetical protein NEDG_01610 [Nematocida displodere]
MGTVRLGITALIMTAQVLCSDVSSFDKEIAQMAGFLVFEAPMVWNSLLFLAHTKNLSTNSMVAKGKKVVSENITTVSSIIKAKKDLSVRLDSFLTTLSKEHSKLTPEKNRVFELDTSEQASNMQKKQIEAAQKTLRTYSTGALSILKKNIKVLCLLNKTQKAKVWKKYGEVLDQMKYALKMRMSVKNRISAAAKEFDQTIIRLLTQTQPDSEAFSIERARFNLGGSIYTPGLLLQITSSLQDKDKEQFIKTLVGSLLDPILLLKSRVASLSPEETKKEVVEFIQATQGTLNVYPMKEQIDTGYNHRSSSIYRYTENLPNKKEVANRIDEIQTHNTARMLSVLQAATSSMFANFVILDKTLESLYLALINGGGGDARKKKTLKEGLGVV